ncbi:MAG TPA: Fur family transcriptional regulator, partial [Chloroflexota bacterium]|nr:Fur family transcriptional regulator [Chloroflexota bacterium]
METRRAGQYRQTAPRRRILAVLREAATPLTAQEVVQRAGTSVPSTYRVLGLLARLGLVSALAEQGDIAAGDERHTARYSLCSEVAHHHHFVCQSCHAVLDLVSPELEAAVATLGQARGLTIADHEVTLRGYCSQCGDP